MLEERLRVQDLKEKKERLVRLKALREAYGINFYRPHWKQHKFHSADVVGRYLRTGNRFGKSDCGAAEDVAWCLGGRMWYREEFDFLDGSRSVVMRNVGGHYNPFVTAGIPDRPVKGLLLVVDWDMSKSVFTNRDGSYDNWGKLFKLIPQESLGKVHVGKNGYVDQIEIKRPGGGSSILVIDTIQSWKHEKLGGESSDWDFIHVDEPCPEQMFKSYARGLMDRNGSFWFTCTPLDQMWINDMFTPAGVRTLDAKEGVEFDTRFVIHGSTMDNPYRSDVGVANFAATLTPEEYECRMNGVPLELAGAVYKEFRYDEHVLLEPPTGWTAWDNPPADYTIRVAWDVHTRLNQAVMLVATAPTGEAFVYVERFCDNMIGVNAQWLRTHLQGRNVVSWLIDPFAVIPSPIDGSSILTELYRFDLYFEKASKDLSFGITQVRERLKERSNVTGKPTLTFSPHLKQTLFEFSHYVYDLAKNEPKDKDNHMMENLYRLVLNGLEYVPKLSLADFVNIRPRPISFQADRDFDLTPTNYL